MLNFMPVPCVMLSGHRQVVLANPAFFELVHRNPDKPLAGATIGEAFNCPYGSNCGQTATCTRCDLNACLQASAQGQAVVARRAVIPQVNHDPLDLMVNAAPLVWEDTPHTLLVITDNEARQKRYILERVFLHDIMNAAGVLYGLSGMLNQVPPEEIEELSGILHHQAKILVDEIAAHQRLLAAEHDELVIKSERINSAALLHEIRAAFEHHDTVTSRTIQISPNAGAVEFTSDELLLQQVLYDITHNALEITPPGGTVTLDCQVKDNRIEFRVHTPAVQPDLHPSKGMKRRRLKDYSITVISRQCLQGEYSFSTSAEQGTVFRVSFPLTLNV